MTERYIELHAASAFSFLEGASLPEDLIQRAAELEYAGHGTAGSQWGYGAARFQPLRVDGRHGVSVGDRGIQPGGYIAPCLRNGCRMAMFPKPRPRPCWTSRAGYQNLCQSITRFKMRETTKKRRRS